MAIFPQAAKTPLTAAGAEVAACITPANDAGGSGGTIRIIADRIGGSGYVFANGGAFIIWNLFM